MQKPCEYCNDKPKALISKEHFQTEVVNNYLYIEGKELKKEKVKINVCPMCGRTLK